MKAPLKFPPSEGWREGEVLRRLHAVAERRGELVYSAQTPLKSLLVQGGTLFSSNLTPQRRMGLRVGADVPSGDLRSSVETTNRRSESDSDIFYLPIVFFKSARATTRPWSGAIWLTSRFSR